jgi:hypothetical protein
MIALVVVTLVLLFIGRSIAKNYMGALADKKGEILALQKRVIDIRKAKQQAESNQKHWKEIGGQTLSMDPNEVATRLRDEMYEVSKKCGLTDTEVNLGAVNPWLKNDVRVLGGTFSAKGTMKQVLDLLFEVYQAPYLVRFRQFTLTQAGGKAPKGTLKITSKIETLILPSNTKVKTIVPAVLEKEKRKPVTTRTLLASNIGDYDKSILDKKMWEQYVPPPPKLKAANPNPSNGGNAPGPDVNLTWTPAPDYTTTHKIFFGTSQPAGELVATQPQPNLMRNGLTQGTTYFWRVDEVFPDGVVVTGDQWTFTFPIPPKPPEPVTKATNPNPAPGSTASTDLAMSWTPGIGATAHKIYLGTTQPPSELLATAAVNNFQKQGLMGATTYFWRVDEIIGDKEITGDVWNFTTATPPPPPPPADSALILARILSSPRGQQVVLADPAQQQNPAAADKRVFVGESLYGGTLVYIHQKGAVSELNGALRFHALGEALQQAQPLTQEVQPEVFHEVKKLEAHAAGISQRPG